MNIKVCGITTLKQVRQLEGLNIDYAGFVFIRDSPWYVGEQIDAKLIKSADFDIRTVGVFQDPEMIDVLDAIDEYGLDVVQLNGMETPEMCEDISSETEVIKAFHLAPGVENDLDKLVAPYDGVCDFYLFSGPVVSGMEPAGQTFNRSLLANSRIEKPFFLSGDIGPDDAAVIKSIRHSDFFGIDINNRFEKEPGVKDMALLLQFLQSLKK